MMSGWNINIKLLYAADQGAFSTIDTVCKGEPFDVIANVEIGENLNEVLDGSDLWVSIRNVSQSTTLLTNQVSRALSPANNVSFSDEIRIAFNGGWKANEGDLLQAVATYKVTAGMNTAYSAAESKIFIVSG